MAGPFCFPHPKDFTAGLHHRAGLHGGPLAPEFAKRNCKVIGSASTR